MDKTLTKQKKRIHINGAIIGLVLLVVAFSLLSEVFRTSYNMINITRQCAINLIIAVGSTMVILTGGIDLSVGGVAALTGTLAAGFLRDEMSLALALILAIIIGIISGAFVGVSVSFGKIPPFVATMAALNIARSIALLYTGGYPITGLPSSFAYLGSGYLIGIPVPVWIAIIAIAIGFFILKKTILGRYIYAIGGNEKAAKLSGINVNMWKVITYGIAGALSAVGGLVMTAKMNSGQPGAASGIELDIIAAIVIGGTSLSGGKGGLFGTILGTLIIAVLDNGLTLLDVNSYWQGIIIGLVIMASVLLDHNKK